MESVHLTITWLIRKVTLSKTVKVNITFAKIVIKIISLERVIDRGLLIIPEKAVAPHSSTLAWRIPWTEEPGRLQSMGSLRVGHDWATSLSLFTFTHWRRKWQPTPVFLPGESQGRGSLVAPSMGLPSMGSHRVRHDWIDLAAAADHIFTCCSQLLWGKPQG